MGSYTIIKNQPLLVDLPSDIIDEGWTVSDDVATHSGCNSGYISKLFDLSEYPQWTFEYEILSVISGSITLDVDGQIGISRNEPGKYVETFNVTGINKLVRLFSDGNNSVYTMAIYPALDSINGTTLMFNEQADRFIQYSSAHPDFMLKFIKRFFMFKDGALWENNVNPVRNNFFGVQYTSRISFFVNTNPDMIKNFSGIHINSDEPWSAPDIVIFPMKRKPNGMKSKLKVGNFKNIQGQWFADFLRNTIDPRFDNELDALFKGANLQGSIMDITIENTSTTEVRLISVDVSYSKQNYTI